MSFRRILDKLFPHRIAERDTLEWASRLYGAPSPPHVKRSVLQRLGLPQSIWIETGTYMGDTAEFLSSKAKHVYSIEPEPRLLALAQARFKAVPNVEILGGRSEEVLPELLSKLSGDVCFWLDGHYSAGVTYKGPKSTPIVEELNAISDFLPRLHRVVVMVDDVRCFEPSLPEYADYPDKSYLIAWAENLRLQWYIEHDIFVARR